jgi:predicted alpha-1,2-mannosidase
MFVCICARAKGRPLSNRICFAALLLLSFSGSILAQQSHDATAEVNPFIGTAHGGNVFPGATVPFGMVQFSPEATPIRSDRQIAAPGGYEYRATALRGFSLTNVEGWGCAGGSGDIPIMPIAEPVEKSPVLDLRHSYSAGFTHAGEHAEPGYYRVALDSGITVELTASTRTGTAAFHFPEGKPASLLFRTSDSEAGSVDAETKIDPAQRLITGSVKSGNFCGYIDKEDRRPYYTLYFAATLDEPFATMGAWHDGAVTQGALSAEGGTGFGAKGFPENGHGSGVWVSFAHAQTVHLRVGVSYVSEANARANLKAEVSGGGMFDGIGMWESHGKLDSGPAFELARDQAHAAWQKRLGEIEIDGGTSEERTVFTTALYHSLMTPTTASDVNGEYRGMDGEVHHLSGGQSVQYANFSGWDVYRSQIQLLTWLDPKAGSDIAQSLLNQATQNQGQWDRWTHNSGATHVMNGDPAAPAVADIWAFGGRDFDAQAALGSLVHAAEVPTAADLSQNGCPVECAGERPGLDKWLTLHYIPVGAPAWGPSADTLEDVTAEFSISALAGRLGQPDTESKFLARAQYWHNIWNPHAAPDGGYFENRNADGSWALVQDDNEKAAHPFVPSTEDGFVEGTAAQYVWMLPFNVKGLFTAMGGTEKAAARLDRFFYDEHGAPAVTEAGPLHAELNNEPSVGTPWLYDWAGQPWKTQQLVRQVLNTIWKNAPDGIPGNDDLGEMSSWAVFASLGMYPGIPGRAEFVLGSPLFPHITVHRAAGDIHITAEGAAPNAPYVLSLTVDGKPRTGNWLPESFALHGGDLFYKLAPAPEKSRGTLPTDAPPSFE